MYSCSLKKYGLVLIALLSVLVLVGCGCSTGSVHDQVSGVSAPVATEVPAPVEAVASLASEPQDLVIGGLPTPDMLLHLRAQEAGYYNPDKVQVTWEQCASAAQCMAYFVAGDYDLVVGDLMNLVLLNASYGEGNFVAIAGVRKSQEDTPMYVLVSANPDVQTPEDLEGKTVAYSIDRVSGFVVKYMLKDAGVSGIESVHVASIPFLFEGMIGKEFDASVLPDQLAFAALELGANWVLSDSRYAQTVLIARADALAKKGDAVTALLFGWNRAAEDFEADPLGYTECKEQLDIPPIILAKYQAVFDMGVPTQEELRLMNQWMVESGFVSEFVDYDAVVDSTWQGG